MRLYFACIFSLNLYRLVRMMYDVSNACLKWKQNERINLAQKLCKYSYSWTFYLIEIKKIHSQIEMILIGYVVRNHLATIYIYKIWYCYYSKSKACVTIMIDWSLLAFKNRQIRCIINETKCINSIQIRCISWSLLCI